MLQIHRKAAARSAAATTSAILEKSIAVLPFVDMNEKHDQEYFGDGMAEEILDLLVKIPKLKVIGRTSSFQFKGKTDDLRTIGTALGATDVVEGLRVAARPAAFSFKGKSVEFRGIAAKLSRSV